MPQEPNIIASICSFCGRPKDDARKIIQGPAEKGICDKCVVLGLLVLLGDPNVHQPVFWPHETSSGSCGFCGRSHKDVWKLLVGEKCNICSKCIHVCCEIIESEVKGLIDKELVAKLPKDNESVKGWTWDCWWCDTYFHVEIFRRRQKRKSSVVA